MDFIADLFRWFWKGKPQQNDSTSRVVSAPIIEPIKISKESSPPKKELDFMPSLTSQDILGDLQSLQSLTQQFDHARQELVSELQRLAPPKKRNPFWEKDAA